MRRKPASQHNGGGYNQHRKPRFQQGGGHHQQGGGYNRPRRNYAAAREKYLAQARDALACGDRVLAENYFQHAEHCYRMMVEEGYNTRQQHQPQAAQPGQGTTAQQPVTEDFSQEMPTNTSQLPAFLTATYQPPQNNGGEPPAVQNWEERDAEA